MNGTREFKHVFQDKSSEGTLSVEVGVIPPAKIRLSVEGNQQVWITANPAGWAHIARIAAELSLGGYEAGYHLHCDFDFQPKYEDGPELSLEVTE